jgi:WS/DGAT/MGAT family acyltransferase
MNDADAVLWTIGHDPVLRTTIGALGILDRPPDQDRLLARLARLGKEVPRLRQRAVSPPLRLGPPRWVDVSDLEVSDHVRRATVTGGFEEVLAVTERTVAEDFDASRPLWQLTVLDGHEEGRSAFVLKLHHSVTDGVGALRLAGHLFDLERFPGAAEPPAARDGGHPAGGLALAGAALRDDVAMAGGLVEGVVRRAPAVVTGTVRHPAGTLADVVRTARSAARLLAPVHAPLSPLMTGRGLGRSVRVLDVPFAELHAAAHRAGCTVNDAFLTAVTGGLSRYHRRHGASVDALRVTMPVNLRAEDDPLAGNRFAPVRFALPVATDDPVQRMREIGEVTRASRREPALPLTDALAFVMNRLPPQATTRLFGAMLKAIDFVATDVPGLDVPVYLAGGRVTRLYALAPPSGAACNISLLSHAGTCCIGVTLDTAAVPDSDDFAADLRAGFDEVLTPPRTSEPGARLHRRAATA